MNINEIESIIKRAEDPTVKDQLRALQRCYSAHTEDAKKLRAALARETEIINEIESDIAKIHNKVVRPLWEQE